MRSSASLLLFLAACGGGRGESRPAGVQPPPTPSAPAAIDSQPLRPPPGAPRELAEAAGPSGTAGAGASAYDTVGRAMLRDEPEGSPARAGHASLPPGSVIEVTALDTGRNALVLVGGASAPPGRYLVSLPPSSAAAIGVSDGAAVRVRTVTPSAPDLQSLRSGQPAAARLDAPPAVLAALRRQMAGVAPAAPAPVPVSQPAPRRAAAPVRVAAARTAPASAPAGRFLVQVAAVSSEQRARSIATSLGGSVQPAGALWRVRMGPYASSADAGRARDAAARRGYADARIVAP